MISLKKLDNRIFEILNYLKKSNNTYKKNLFINCGCILVRREGIKTKKCNRTRDLKRTKREKLKTTIINILLLTLCNNLINARFFFLCLIFLCYTFFFLFL